ncbi:hypothetical protein G6Z94_07170 [Vibrio aestuarianus]|uniref:hypothetical protein n=1 Tax=Vibrio aestuarianus TaxID=28171 RepID=UPI001592C485|nr:hypothetical protein [Vibrio aestuarianus]NGZ17131.1 hypothetical protein [Vibrio aestuarianus]
MSENSRIDGSSPSVQTHLGILQAVIQRMAVNSASSKAWCITIVSAILVIIADKGKPEFAWIAVIPIILFMCLDAYYLALEKGFRASYNTFVRKLHGGTLEAEDLYSVLPEGNQSKHQWESFKSFSVWGFYIGLFVLVAITKMIVLS